MGSSGHEEGTWRVFWAWVEGATGNMALALRGLVEQVLSWTPVGGLGGHLGLWTSMDTLHTLLVGWLVFVVLILAIGGFFYVKFVKKLEEEKLLKAAAAAANSAQPEEEDGEVFPTQGSSRSAASGRGGGGAGRSQAPAGKKVAVARKPTIVPDGPREPVAAPVATGADPDAVNWTNNIFTWFYNSVDGGPIMTKTWLETVSENTVKTALETGILVEVVEVYKSTPAPVLSNMVVDCSPSDNLTITCDCDTIAYIRLITTRTQGEETTESEYACAVSPLRGRLNIAVITEQLMAVVKFDGWPEVGIELEGIRNNATGLHEQSIVDVVTEVVTSAVRNSVLEMNFQNVSTFPRFRRARQAPDKIIPVGYDAMVRELQTHPPEVGKPKSVPVSLHRDEELVEAGESFTSLPFSHSLSQQGVLTTSEEQLIVRNLNKYPSLENTELDADDVSEWQKSWEQNYVPASEVPAEEPVPNEMTDVAAVLVEIKEPSPSPSPTKNFVLVASNRSKLIDEPRTELTIEEVIDDEVESVVRDAHDEPCLRRVNGSARDSILATPVIEPPKKLEDEDEEDLDHPLRLEEMEFTDKSLTGTSGVGPLPALPGLQKGPFVSNVSSSTQGQPMGIPGLNGKRLLVKIVKAVGIGCDKSVSEAYAVVEMDEPAQKFTTAVVKDTSSPFWDEQFLFDLSEGTLELLFELYDKIDGNFLGLGIVGIEELVATPSQRQIIPLQSRPYEDDEVSGSLTVEFLFLDRADLPDLTLRSSATSQSLSAKGDLVTTTTTTYVKAPECKDVIVNGGDGVAAAVLRDIEEKKVVVANNANKSTMIIHASRKEMTKRVIQVQRAPSGEYKELMVQPGEEDGYNEIPVEDLTALTTTATTTTTTVTTSITQSTAVTNSVIAPSTTTTTASTTTTTNTESLDPSDLDERGRSRGNRRKRDSFFGTLKKRFSRSKVRSKSMDPGARDVSLDRDPSVGRSVSMERAANVRASEEQHETPLVLQDPLSTRLLSVPASTGGDGGSTRSSISDTSAISSSSTRTYVNEASTLIVETSENGILKHFLIPLALQQKSKWRKKGLKLHVFGEHTFIAKHMPSSTPCQVCQKTLGRRFGKQGYECRDCGFKCHKPCHVKTDTVCPNSTVNNMDLEYVKDPREERRNRLKKLKST
ncbi:uncharacterized protein [Macrobrachium rosenbergii]|uniref:uncharacterized protein isoform X13 n=1 Tax=Macrobrachium rosenbergii TaxID=79674 RepID=UPI0034D5EE27